MTEVLAQRVETPVEVAPVTPTTPSDEILVPEPSTRPPSLENEPYLIKMLDLGYSADHFEMPTLIKEANDFILSEIKRNKLEDTRESFKKIVEKYTKGIPDDTTKYALVEHILDLMRIDKKLIDAMLEKAEIEKKPIEELTSRQLKARIEAM